MFWFNTFFIDMHLLQQQTYHQRSSSHKQTDYPDQPPSSDRHSSTTSSDSSLHLIKRPHGGGHQRNRSGTPAMDSASGTKSKIKQPRDKDRATSPSASMYYY